MTTKEKIKSMSRGVRIALTAVLIGIMALTCGFVPSRHVTIIADGQTYKVESTYSSPRNIIMQAGVTMGDGDEYQLSLDENKNAKITVYRASSGMHPTQDNPYDRWVGIKPEIPQMEFGVPAYAAPAAPTVPIHGTSLVMEATAYLPGDGNGDGITAIGLVAQHGVVAVDPDIIPLGTRLYIPGYGEAIAADTGGAIVGNRIDLCMESYGEAMSFGRQDVAVYILD